MITIYLLFRLTAGSLDEVDAFKDLESCQAYQVAIEGQLESAKRQMPGRFDQIEFSACQPFSVPVPKGTKGTI